MSAADTLCIGRSFTATPGAIPIPSNLQSIVTRKLAARICNRPKVPREHRSSDAVKPVSVSFHFTRKCNLECAFCFHTEKTSYVASEHDMKNGLRLLSEAGMRKINFAGGEPFLYPKRLAMLCRFCKEDLGLESVSIITNGTHVTREWMEQYGQWVDVMGVSCDSFNEETNKVIGRGTGKNVEQLFRIRDWCRQLGIKFKLNTVVCTHNWEEDMAGIVGELDPFRWKVFQVLYVEGENDAEEKDTRLDKRKRNARKLLISDEQFQTFCDKHRHLKCFVPEPNSLMASSYLLVDEYLCFLDKGEGVEKQSRSILEVGVQKALSEVRWDQDAFKQRGGLYEWTKDVVEGMEGGCGSGDKMKTLLDW
ncbi:radical SAM enzyme [Hypoxylon sp. EC38]|nr:radical SAM enzyme [Hypoxylon sp. EC38]